MKIKYTTGIEEIGIVNGGLARTLSGVGGFQVRSFDSEAAAVAFLKSFLNARATGEQTDDWLKPLAKSLAAGDLVVVSKHRGETSFIHPRPGEISPLEAEQATRQRDPEPAPPPPPTEPVEPMVVKPEQLKTDAPLCEL